MNHNSRGGCVLSLCVTDILMGHWSGHATSPKQFTEYWLRTDGNAQILRGKKDKDDNFTAGPETKWLRWRFTLEKKKNNKKVAGFSFLAPYNFCALYAVLPLATSLSEPSNGLMPLLSMAWYTKNRKAATTTSRNRFIHRDMPRVAALVWPAGGAVDRGLEEVEEFKEVEGGKLVTLLTMWLSVQDEDELVVFVIFGEKRKFSLFHRSLDFIGRSAAPLMGRRQVALWGTRILQSLISHLQSYILLSLMCSLIFSGVTKSWMILISDCKHLLLRDCAISPQ